MSSPFVEALGAISRACAAAGVDWYLFGAQAALLYGAARLTADIDVTVRLPAGAGVEDLVEALTNAGCPPRLADPDFVRRTRVIPIVHATTSVHADIVLAGPGIEDLFFERARERPFGELVIPVASPEDIIAMKLLAGRGKDIDDVRAILGAQKDSIDLTLLRETLRLLETALDQSDLTPELDALLARLPGRSG